MSQDVDVDGVIVEEGAILGIEHKKGTSPPEIGQDSIIRSGTVVYNNVEAGQCLQTGHHALIREQTVLGKDVLVGTHAVIDGHVIVGNSVSMQTGVYIPSHTEVDDRVFFGPNATLLNDLYPVRNDTELIGPKIRNDATVGANATILPEITIGAGAFIAAGAVVTNDVPSGKLAIGAPATIQELPEHLEGGNKL